jgi:hypothetical protein
VLGLIKVYSKSGFILNRKIQRQTKNRNAFIKNRFGTYLQHRKLRRLSVLKRQEHTNFSNKIEINEYDDSHLKNLQQPI